MSEAEPEKDLLGRGPVEPVAGRRRRCRDREQDVLAAERQDREADEDEHRERAEDDRPRADPVVEPAADDAADDARHGEQDAEDAEFRRAPAEHAGAVDAAEGEQRHEAVLVDHVGEEEAGHGAVPPRLLHRPAEMGEGLAKGGPEPAIPWTARPG